MSHHPIHPGAESLREVFEALLETVTDDGSLAFSENERAEWRKRWRKAQGVAMERRAYDRRWDESLMGVTRFGQ